MLIKTSKALFLAGIVTAFSAGPAAAGTYNPTASDNNWNTAGGTGALPQNQGTSNTAFGIYALQVVTNGSANTALGTAAMYFNSSGNNNTAVGASTLNWNSSGSYNTAVGGSAMLENSTGQNNTAMGFNTLSTATTGGYNVGDGSWSLYNTTSGIGNVAVGSSSLYTNTTASMNTAVGIGTLYETTGSDNIGIGQYAGYYNTSGNYNIEIGNYGQSGESNTMRLGTGGSQTRTFIAGISGVNLSGGGSEVYINSSGQLGTVNSSARYKQDIADMADESAALSKLRPVTFSYKSDPAREKQYGLIAEEVAEVYPNLVVRNADGQIESVRYYELAPMLLNEMHKQQQTIKEQQVAIQQLSERLAKLESQR